METNKTTQSPDPRSSLAQWANDNYEWIRRIVRLVLGSNGEVTNDDRAQIFRLFLEEKGLDDRTLAPEPPIVFSGGPVGHSEPFHLARLSDVKGVNALVEGGQIEFGPGLTLLYGENGTGKTGYSRILKTIAGSRSADDILPNVKLEGAPSSPSAEISYRLGVAECEYHWNGERAQPPFDRMSIFDSPSVHFHVDTDLNYTYSPAALAIFDRARVEVQQIGTAIDTEVGKLNPNNSTLLGRFDSSSTIYPYVQSLNATSDLTDLKRFAHLPDDAEAQKEKLETTLVQLKANSLGQELALKVSFQQVLTEASAFASVAESLDVSQYNDALSTLSDLRRDQVSLRDSLFASAGLPAEPDQTWEEFIRSGQAYRQHLEIIGAHDNARCIYCRQVLNSEALQLLAKYGDYLEDQIAQDIRGHETTIRRMVEPIQNRSLAVVRAYVAGVDSDPNLGLEAGDNQIDSLRTIMALDENLGKRFTDGSPSDENIPARASAIKNSCEIWLSGLRNTITELQQQSSNREETIKEKETELCELQARLTLVENWSEIKEFVASAKRAEKLKNERQAISNVLRRITGLASEASKQLINEHFEHIFRGECESLRVPDLKLEFVGREGHPLRRRTLPSNHKPSMVLSEGEQKVVAIADFIAEVKMSDNAVPVIFDDPVSSLDHRRVKEVAERIGALASDHQVVVFTHDIFFAMSLLEIFDKSASCKYYRITDEDGKGTVTPGTAPRWDTIRNLTTQINLIIEDAKKTPGEAREAHVRKAYGVIRSWCELFVEQDVLAQVTGRFQPNVRMTSLENINISMLDETIETVTSIFEDACRYIDAHSQPLPTLGVGPTLVQLQNDWDNLKKCRSAYNNAKN